MGCASRMTTTILPAFALVLALLTIGSTAGCRFNNAKLTHGMGFATIEDTVQRSVRLQDSRDAVVKVAETEWKLQPNPIDVERESILSFDLAPKVEGTLGKSRHRSYLTFEFDEAGVVRAWYTNYSFNSTTPHGVSEIRLWRARP